MSAATAKPEVSPTKVRRPGPFTFDDFCALVAEKQKADLIDGVIYMASPENAEANSLFVWLASLMSLYVEAKNLGEIYGSRVALRLDHRNGPEPDIMFVRRQRLHLVEGGHVNGPADLAVEIVSPESVERDYVKKRAQYEQFKVPEYWIVDEAVRRITALWLASDGFYRDVEPKDGTVHSRALPGFWLRPEWLWQQLRPNRPRILKQLLKKKG